MESFEGFSPQDLERWKSIYELQKKASSNLEGYYETLKNLHELESNLRHVNKERIKTEKRLTDLANKKAELEKDSLYMTNKNYHALLKQMKVEEKKLEIAEEMIRIGEANTRILSEQVNKSNFVVASTKSLVGVLKNVGGQLEANLDYWLDQQKAVKMAGLNMGVLSKQAGTFRNTLYKSSLITNEIGVDTKMLAEMQASYSEGVGRSVQLNEENLKAMAELAKGTILGAEGAARLASDMEVFNLSVVSSRDIVKNMLNDAYKMGVNGAKSTKELEKNLKLANKYHFKGGIEGLGKMVNIAAKFKIEMGQIGDFADKIFDIEGATEMAAQLQVLGGGWSKLGDPFSLMFKARNDLEGLTKDIISATDVTGQFNKATGEFEISALELSRLREVAKATGMDFNMLSESAKSIAKTKMVKGQVTGFLDDEDKEFVATLAQYDKSKKAYVIRIDGQDIPVKEMHKFNKNHLKAIREEKASLEERAKDSQTFDETWKNIVNTVKSALLPGFEKFSTSIEGGLKTFIKWMKDNDVVDRIVTFGKYFGEKAAWFIDKMVEWPKTTAAVIGAALIGKELMWLGRGMLLGEGFNMTANAGGLGGKLGKGVMGSLGQNSGNSFGKNLTGGLASKMVKLGGVATGLFEAYNEFNKNSSSGMDQDENIGRTAIKGSTTGLGAWGGAAAGAALGTLIFPGVGTAIGGLIGGGLGAWGGSEIGEGINSGVYGQKMDDFIARPGSDPIPFNSADTLVGLKKDGGIGKALVENATNKGGKFEVSFTSPIKFEGNINLNTPQGTSKMTLDDPLFIRALTRIIQEELSRSIGGGKLSSNPINN